MAEPTSVEYVGVSICRPPGRRPRPRPRLPGKPRLFTGGAPSTSWGVLAASPRAAWNSLTAALISFTASSIELTTSFSLLRLRELALDPWLLSSRSSAPFVSATASLSSPFVVEEEFDLSDSLVRFDGRSSSVYRPSGTARRLIESANELRRLSALPTEVAVESVVPRDVARVVICNGVDG